MNARTKLTRTTNRTAAAEFIYIQVSGADNRAERARLTQDIHEWLTDGDANGCTLGRLAREYREERM